MFQLQLNERQSRNKHTTEQSQSTSALCHSDSAVMETSCSPASCSCCLTTNPLCPSHRWKMDHLKTEKKDLHISKRDTSHITYGAVDTTGIWPNMKKKITFVLTALESGLWSYSHSKIYCPKQSLLSSSKKLLIVRKLSYFMWIWKWQKGPQIRKMELQRYSPARLLTWNHVK